MEYEDPIIANALAKTDARPRGEITAAAGSVVGKQTNGVVEVAKKSLIETQDSGRR